MDSKTTRSVIEDWRLPPVLRFKLMPPQSRLPQLRREAILGPYFSTAVARLTSVVAPAGYGKTTLLQQMYDQIVRQQQPAIWVCLDQHDNNISRWCAVLSAALKQLNRGDSPLEDVQYPFPSNANVDDWVIQFITAASGFETPLTIFLDDLHLVINPKVLEVLGELLAFSKGSIHWVFSSREMIPGLSLARLRVLGDLQEITAEQLAFSCRETFDYCRRCTDIDVDSSTSKMLRDKTEGWIAGIQLATLSLERSNSSGQSIEDFTGSHPYCREFLADEVFSDLSESIKSFLTATAFVERFCKDLCLALTESPSSGEIFDEVVSLKLFVFELDDKQEWYRYHHLFAEFLRRRLMDTDPPLVTRLHLRAADWFAAEGIYVEAIYHACEGGDFARAAYWLEIISEQLMANGHVEALDVYSERIPTTILRQFPSLMMDIVWEQILHWDFSTARKALLDVEASLRGSDESENLSSERMTYLEGKLLHRKMMYAYISDDLIEAERLCCQWMDARFPEETNVHMLTSVTMIHQTARRERFDIQRPQPLAQAMDKLCVSNDIVHGSIYHNCQLGITLLAQLDLQAAGQSFELAIDLGTSLQGKLSALTAMPSLLLADVLWSMGDETESERLLCDYWPLAQAGGIADQLIAGVLTRSRIEESRNGAQAALAVLDEGEKLVWAFGFSRFLSYLTHERIRLLVSLGHEGAASRIGREQGLSIGRVFDRENATVQTLYDDLSAVRLAAIQNNVMGAIQKLNRWKEYLEQRRCTRQLMQVCLLLSVFYWRSGDRQRALHILSQLLQLKGVQQCVNLLFLEGTCVATMVLELQDSVSLSEDLLAKAKVMTAVRDQTASIDPNSRLLRVLKAREIEILQLAADDRSNSEIGERLSISTNTVKWYWRQIFEKLAVRRRGAAVRVAKDLGVVIK